MVPCLGGSQAFGSYVFRCPVSLVVGNPFNPLKVSKS